MRIIRIGLEPLPERYTMQWAQWIPAEFQRLGAEYSEIPGQTLTNKIEDGKVLDASGTMYYKFSQLQRIAELFKTNQIQNGDIFFVDDIQFPGIWSIKYQAKLYNKKIYIYGYLHASSYTTEDFTEPMTSFLKSVERSWLFTYDKIFVGTQYHKNSFINRRFPHSYRSAAEDRIIVTGAPWNVWSIQQMTYGSKYYKEGDKFKRIIFPNRFDIEKRPNIFLMMIDYIYNHLKIQDIDFLIITSREKLTGDSNLLDMLKRTQKLVPKLEVITNATKVEYYINLASSKLMLSTTIEENFGYCIIEALSLNTRILVPDNYSHSELIADLPHQDQKDSLYDINWLSYKNNFELPSESIIIDSNIVRLGTRALHIINLPDKFDLYEATIKYNESIENMFNIIERDVNGKR